MKITWENFHEATAADFQPCETPIRRPDYTSFSGSRYWQTDAGVIRQSDHWCTYIRSCHWFLAGKQATGLERTGFCRYANFHTELTDCRPFAEFKTEQNRRLDEWDANEEKLTKLKQPGQTVRVLRRWTERLSARSYERCEERIVFTIRKLTACFAVATDGHRFGLHTLSDWQPAK